MNEFKFIFSFLTYFVAGRSSVTVDVELLLSKQPDLVT